MPRMIPRSWLVRSLALAATLSMVMAQENADNCPADLVSFEVITGELLLFQIAVKMSLIILIVRICVHCPSGHA